MSSYAIITVQESNSYRVLINQRGNILLPVDPALTLEQWAFNIIQRPTGDIKYFERLPAQDSKQAIYHIGYDGIKKMLGALLGKKENSQFYFVNVAEIENSPRAIKGREFLKTLNKKLIAEPKPQARSGLLYALSADWSVKENTTSPQSLPAKPTIQLNVNSPTGKRQREFNKALGRTPEKVLRSQGALTSLCKSPGGKLYLPAIDSGPFTTYVPSEGHSDYSNDLNKVIEEVSTATKRGRVIDLNEAANKAVDYKEQKTISTNDDDIVQYNPKAKRALSSFFGPANDSSSEILNQSPASDSNSACSESDGVSLAELLATVEASNKKLNEPFYIRYSTTLTKKDLVRVLKEKASNGNKRVCSQSSLFNNKSANEMAKELNLKGRFHLSHLVFYSGVGAAGQVKGNIILGTAEFNFTKMHLEFVLRMLMLAGHNVKPDVYGYNESATELDKLYHHAVIEVYDVIIDDYPMVRFTFDPHSEILPDRHLWKGYLAYLKQKMADHDAQVSASLQQTNTEVQTNPINETAEGSDALNSLLANEGLSVEDLSFEAFEADCKAETAEINPIQPPAECDTYIPTPVSTFRP